MNRQKLAAALFFAHVIIAGWGGAGALYANRAVNLDSLLRAIVETVDPRVVYIPDYVKIPYPMGDVPEGTGVCTDVIIRVYRKVGIDLQKELHEDIRANFGKYPNQKRWGLTAPDRNIDHRRVPNLMVFFSRHGESLRITDKREDYKPGHIVAWDLNGRGLLHIGIVSGQPVSADNPEEGYLILHNIGGGQILENCLFSWKIIGHYKYMGKKR